MAFCLENDPEGQDPEGSFTVLVKWQQHYAQDPDAVWRAEVQYVSPDSPDKLQGSKELWFWAMNKQVEQAVYAGLTR